MKAEPIAWAWWRLNQSDPAKVLLVRLARIASPTGEVMCDKEARPLVFNPNGLIAPGRAELVEKRLLASADDRFHLSVSFDTEGGTPA